MGRRPPEGARGADGRNEQPGLEGAKHGRLTERKRETVGTTKGTPVGMAAMLKRAASWLEWLCEEERAGKLS